MQYMAVEGREMREGRRVEENRGKGSGKGEESEMEGEGRGKGCPPHCLV